MFFLKVPQLEKTINIKKQREGKKERKNKISLLSQQTEDILDRFTDVQNSNQTFEVKGPTSHGLGMTCHVLFILINSLYFDLHWQWIFLQD